MEAEKCLTTIGINKDAMGNILVTQNSPANITGAAVPVTHRDFFDRFGRVLGEFTRTEAGPDVDVYDTQTLIENQDVHVALFPSFLIFDETFGKCDC